MSIKRGKAPYSLRKLTVLVAGLGLLIVAGIGESSSEPTTAGGGADCPQWTSPVCRAWSLGPPPKCTEYACVADKKSDPPKAAANRGLLSRPGLLEGDATLSPGRPTVSGQPATAAPRGLMLK